MAISPEESAVAEGLISRYGPDKTHELIKNLLRAYARDLIAEFTLEIEEATDPRYRYDEVPDKLAEALDRLNKKYDSEGYK